MVASKTSWAVYIARCADNTLYTGIAKDVEKRINQHNHDNRVASRYTRARRPVRLVYQEPCLDRAQASKREAIIKKLNKQEKELLIEQGRSNYRPVSIARKNS